MKISEKYYKTKLKDYDFKNGRSKSNVSLP